MVEIVLISFSCVANSALGSCFFSSQLDKINSKIQNNIVNLIENKDSGLILFVAYSFPGKQSLLWIKFIRKCQYVIESLYFQLHKIN